MRGWLFVVAVAGGAGCGGGDKPVAKPTEVGPSQRVPVSDEEPEDGLELRNERGRMEREVIEAGIAPHKDTWVDCFQARVGNRRWLGGKVAIRWDISADGTITEVKLFESDLGAWPIEQCLLEAARAATFGKPVGGDADFMLPLEFPSRGRPDVWDDDQALRAVGGQVAKLDECGKPPETPKKPAKRGKKAPPVEKPIVVPDEVVITVYVGPRGEAQSVGFASQKSMIDDAWAECATKVAMGWRLPDPKGTVAKLAVRYR
jgi:hypothetical protein